MDVTSLLLGINRSGSATVMISNNFPITLPFHVFSSFLGSLSLSIYGFVGADRWYSTSKNIIHVFLPTWWHPKYLFYLFSNIELTRIARQKRMTPILGLCLAWCSYFELLFNCHTLYVNVSQMLPIRESRHVTHLIPFQLG